MKLYHPQVHLIKQTHMEAPDEYWLHAVTFCNKTNYRAVGHATLPKVKTKDRIYRVGLKIAKDMELSELTLLTPVVHTLYLGKLPFDAKDGLIEVRLSVMARGGGTTVGTATVSPSGASEKRERPIDIL